VDDITRIFTSWPAAIPKKATVVTTMGDNVPFDDFMLTKDLVLLIRPQPDAQGTRRVIMKLSNIASIRIADAIDPERFTAMGFQKNTAITAARPVASS